jgi:hypothetical protein
MSVLPKEREILRGLAAKLAEIAARPEQQTKADLWRRLNSLERVRPMVLLQNATWHENASEITMECESEFARGQEWGLRTALYHAEHMPDDTVYEAVIHSPVVVWDQGYGIHGNTTDPDHVFGARHYNTVLADDASPEQIPMPVVEVNWDETERIHGQLSDLYEGILEVRKRGVGGFWFAIMDDFITWRDIDRAFVDMVDRPEWVHAWLERMTRFHLSRLDQYEQLGVLSLNNGNHGVGPGGLGFTDELPGAGFDAGHVRTRDMWGFATTQIFSEVSPAMHEEFALQYESRFLERFGLAGYGCCEPLDAKVGIIRRWLPNLRRLSMSPWVDVARGAEALGRDAIFSWKPNPAMIGMEKWDARYVEGLIRDAFEKTRGCVVEVLMKDLHTTRGEPWRMWEWVRIAMELAEEYAG